MESVELKEFEGYWVIILLGLGMLGIEVCLREQRGAYNLCISYFRASRVGGKARWPRLHLSTCFQKQRIIKYRFFIPSVAFYILLHNHMLNYVAFVDAIPF